MAATKSLLTVAEFAKIPDLPESRYELRHGELIRVPPPKPDHAHTARNVFLALMRAIGGTFYVNKEFAFRPLPEHEVWIADVAAIEASRWKAADRTDWLNGAPTIVIEVLSPSNTAQEMIDKEATCFEGGCLEFWLVDPRRQQVRTSRNNRIARIYSGDDMIQMDMFGGASFSVTEVFAA